MSKDSKALYRAYINKLFKKYPWERRKPSEEQLCLVKIKSKLEI